MRPVYRHVWILVFLSLAGEVQGQEAVPPSRLIDSFLAETDYRKRGTLEDQLAGLGKEGRDAVWRRLAAEPDERAVARLTSLLASFRVEGTASRLEGLARSTESRSIRSTAVSGLSRQGEDGAQALWRLYGSLEEVRAWVLTSLALCEGPSAAGFLSRTVRKESNTALGIRAARCLAFHDPVAATRTFLRTLGKGSPAMIACQAGFLAELADLMPPAEAKKVRKKLRGLGPVLVHALKDDGLAPVEAAETLGLMHFSGALEPLRALAADPPYASVTAVTLWALGEIDAPAARTVFLSGLGQRDVHGHLVKRMALRGLGRTSDASVAGAVVVFLDHEDAALRTAACQALADLDAREAGPEIARRLLEDRNKTPASPGSAAGRVSITMAGALARLECAEAVYPLSRLAREKNVALRRAALEALARIPGPAALQALKSALESDELEPGDYRVVAGALLDSTEGASDPTRAGVAADLFIKWTDRPLARAVIEGSLRGRGSRNEADGHTTSDLGAALIERVASGDGAEARAACRLLGILGDDRSVEPLLASLRRPELRAAAAEALGRLGDDQAIEALLPLTATALQDVARASSDAVLRILPVSDPRREVIARRVAQSTVSTAADSHLSLLARRHAFERLELAADPRGREAALEVVTSGDASDLRLAAAGALTAMRPDQAGAEKLLEILPATTGRLRCALFDALLAARSPSIDGRVLALGKGAQDPVLRFAVRVYELRCGRMAAARKLVEPLGSLRPVMRSNDHAIHSQAFTVLGWFTGCDAEDRHLLPRSIPYSAGWRCSGRYASVPAPPFWETLRWIEEHAGELEDDAAFAAAVRAGKETKLRGYLRRYPKGRHAAQTERLLERSDFR